MNWNSIRTSFWCSDLKWKCMYECSQVCITSGYYIMFLRLFFIMAVPHCFMPFYSWKREFHLESGNQIFTSLAGGVSVKRWFSSFQGFSDFCRMCWGKYCIPHTQFSWGSCSEVAALLTGEWSWLTGISLEYCIQIWLHSPNLRLLVCVMLNCDKKRNKDLTAGPQMPS